MKKRMKKLKFLLIDYNKEVDDVIYILLEEKKYINF